MTRPLLDCLRWAPCAIAILTSRGSAEVLEFGMLLEEVRDEPTLRYDAQPTLSHVCQCPLHEHCGKPTATERTSSLRVVEDEAIVGDLIIGDARQRPVGEELVALLIGVVDDPHGEDVPGPHTADTRASFGYGSLYDITAAVGRPVPDSDTVASSKSPLGTALNSIS